MDVSVMGREACARAAESRESLSYKFQRLRERLRQAIVSGQLTGKLPGERVLARRFRANPKTLGKALTDLAAEGLLDRSVGRGTYVRGTAAVESGAKWLAVCDSADSPLLQPLRQHRADLEVVSHTQRLRPSFVSQFDVVIDVTGGGGDAQHREWLVRNMTVMVLGREAGACKVHAVLLDRAHAAYRLARDILLAGHRRIAVVDPMPDGVVLASARLAAARYVPGTRVDACTIDEAAAGADTAILCGDERVAGEVRSRLENGDAANRPSLVAIGLNAGSVPCTGIYITPAEIVRAAVETLTDPPSPRPLTLYLEGTCVDQGTLRAVVLQGP